MKQPALSILPWRRAPYGIAIFSFLLALSFCIVFFEFAQILPETVPIHWSERGGFDKWMPTSGLYPLALIPLGYSAFALPSSILLIRRDLNGFAYLISGISLFLTCAMALFLTCVMILVAAVMMNPVAA